MKNSILVMIAVGLVLGLTLSGEAVLIDRGGGMIYSTDLNITWLQDANYARTTGHDVDGLMTGSDAMTWAADLVYGGYDDWRLPTFDEANPGDITLLHEMAWLNSVELGNASMDSISTPGPFINLNLPPSDPSTGWIEPWYWSGTLVSNDPTSAWRFSFWCY